jgi:D-glycero-D-manno-heptose 1,7-bisphosphate phosphatase
VLFRSFLAFKAIPNVGMALKARKDLPDIKFRKSVMAGDSLSDMVFGKRLGMKTVLLTKDISLIKKGAYFIDSVFEDLKTFADYISQIPSPLPRHYVPRSKPSPHSPTSP